MPTGEFYMHPCRLLIFSKSTFSKTSLSTINDVSNSLGSDQSRRFVGTDLRPNCLQKLSAGDTSLLRVTSIYMYYVSPFLLKNLRPFQNH